MGSPFGVCLDRDGIASQRLGLAVTLWQDDEPCMQIDVCAEPMKSA